MPNIPINEAAQNAKNHDSAAVIITENDFNQRVTIDEVKAMREEMCIRDRVGICYEETMI